MPKDRRRGRRRRQAASRPAPATQQSSQPASPPRPVAGERVVPAAKTPAPAKQAELANPHLAKDLRNIAIVTAMLLVLLVVLHFVLR